MGCAVQRVQVRHSPVFLGGERRHLIAESQVESQIRTEPPIILKVPAIYIVADVALVNVRVIGVPRCPEGMVRQKSQQCPGCSGYCGPSAWGSERTVKDASTVAASRAVSKIPQPDEAETIFQIVISARGKGIVVNLAALQTVVLVCRRV